MRTRQKQRVATDTWRSLGCRTTPITFKAAAIDRVVERFLLDKKAGDGLILNTTRSPNGGVRNLGG